MSSTLYTIEPVGYVRSELTRLEDPPMQGDEGAPDAWLELTSQSARGMMGITVGDELIVLTWLHLAQRDVLQVHPRGDLCPTRGNRWNAHRGYQTCTCVVSIGSLTYSVSNQERSSPSQYAAG